jgi:hypothetical protein
MQKSCKLTISCCSFDRSWPRRPPIQEDDVVVVCWMTVDS